MDCIRIRVGLPRVARGPAPDVADNPFTEIRLPDGRFRGFTAAGITIAIDGDKPWAMGGPGITVLKRGAPNSSASCGQWLQHAEPAGKLVVGWIHSETECNYAKGQTHKSMEIATSADNGLTWHVEGQIIAGIGPPEPGRNTGEGDCTAVDGKDGYYYAYCWRNRGGGRTAGTIVARAPVSDPSPRNWKKYFNGSWSEPGLGGDATALNVSGASARWLPTGETVLFGGVPGGAGIYFSQDHVNFTAFPVPVIPGDYGTWNRPAPHDLVAYEDLLDAETGSNQLGDHWLQAYMYILPNEGFGRRYLVMRPVEISRDRKADEPQASILLARWYNPQLHDRWSTTEPVPPVNGAEYRVEATLGYLMTAPDAKRPSVELEDCLSHPGKPLVHVLMPKTPQGHVCENHGYTRTRTAGFVFSAPQSDAQPLYSCSDSAGSHFASNTADCDHLGQMESILGYDLKE